MAKAKKTETSAAASKAPAKKTAKAKPAASTGMPSIDTGLAAESAAKFLVAKLPTGNSNFVSGGGKESSSFKHLKESVANPAASSMASMLDKTSGSTQKKSNTPFHGGKQTGRNQTFGADVNRTGLPRRTGG